MKVNKLMIRDPITITASATIQEAIELMKVNSIRHLPVVDKQKRLTGFVTLADLKQGFLPSMLGDVTLKDLIIKDPLTVGPEDDVETAARIIYRYKVGGIPVVEGKRLVGIITESDIFRAFIDMMGMLSASSRIDVSVGDDPGAFRKALQIISDSGGDIINVGMTAQESHQRVYYFRLAACKTAKIRKVLEKEGYEVLEAMD